MTSLPAYIVMLKPKFIYYHYACKYDYNIYIIMYNYVYIIIGLLFCMMYTNDALGYYGMPSWNTVTRGHAVGVDYLTPDDDDV